MTAEVIQALTGFATLLLFVMTSFFFGGKKWRGNYEAEHVKAQRLEATLVEKDKEISGQADRLRRLDELLLALSPTQLVENQKENLEMFARIVEKLERMETTDNLIVGALQDLKP